MEKEVLKPHFNNSSPPILIDEGKNEVRTDALNSMIKITEKNREILESLKLKGINLA